MKRRSSPVEVDRLIAARTASAIGTIIELSVRLAKLNVTLGIVRHNDAIHIRVTHWNQIQSENATSPGSPLPGTSFRYGTGDEGEGDYSSASPFFSNLAEVALQNMGVDPLEAVVWGSEMAATFVLSLNEVEWAFIATDGLKLRAADTKKLWRISVALERELSKAIREATRGSSSMMSGGAR